MFMKGPSQDGVAWRSPDCRQAPRRRASRDSSAPFAAPERRAHNGPMFAPSPEDVRGFFVEARRKRAERLPLTPLETIAADWIDAHPEYAGDLADADSSRQAVYPPEGG